MFQHINNYKSITLNHTQFATYELIKNNCLYPLDKFMNKQDFYNTLNNMKLISGEFFPIPIVLSINEKKRDELIHCDYVILKHETGLPLCLINIDSSSCIYEINLSKIKDNETYYNFFEHNISKGLCYNLTGNIVNHFDIPHHNFNNLRLDQSKIKSYFRENGWKRVLGFHHNGIINRKEKNISEYCLSTIGEGAKLLIICDNDSHINIKCYKELLNYYDENTVLLSILPICLEVKSIFYDMLLRAFVFKNLGCTHFYSTGLNENNLLDLNKYFELISITPVNYNEVQNINENKQNSFITNDDSLVQDYSFKKIKEIFNYNTKNGLVIYFVGLINSGKSTLAYFLKKKLEEITNRSISYYDGELIRNHLSKGLGFTKEDRSTNIRRIGFLCSEICKHNGLCIAANIAPYSDDRNYNRNLIKNEGGNYVEIFVNTDIKVCEQRDTKNLYKLARQGILKEFTGVNDPFEIPTDSEIIIDGNDDIEYNLNIIIKYLNSVNLL